MRFVLILNYKHVRSAGLRVWKVMYEFLGKSISHVNHGLVVRILASGAAGLGSKPGRVTCGIEEK
jgi:hypothetical protein